MLQCLLSVKFDDDGRLFSETAQLTSSYFTCIFKCSCVAKKWLGQNPNSPTAYYSNAEFSTIYIEIFAVECGAGNCELFYLSNLTNHAD